MEAYFDNSATTIVTDSVKDIVVKNNDRGFWKSISYAYGWS